MALITRIEITQVDLAPRVKRSDAIQSFVTQETPLVRIRCDDGAEGVGYPYTIGTGESSVIALLRAAVPNAAWVEYIPQLDDITTSRIAIADGYALPSPEPGLGIAWDWKAIAARAVASGVLER